MHPSLKERLSDLTRPTGEEDLLEVEYPRPRIAIPMWLACIIGAGLLIAFILWRSFSADSPGFPGSAPEGTEQAMIPPSSVSPSAESTAPAVVSVVGAVNSPGLVTLEPGARVADALDAAGLRGDAVVTELNLAEKLSDGQQVHVRTEGEPAPLPTPGSSTEKSGESSGSGININLASAEELTELPGVGEVTAAAIITYREDNGPFASVENLLEVPGIGPAKFAQIEQLVQI